MILTRLFGKGDIKDGVSSSLVAGNQLSGINIEKEHHMLIGSISASNVSAIWGDSDGRALSGVLVKLESCSLRTILGVPNEDGWELTDLSGSSPLSVS